MFNWNAAGHENVKKFLENSFNKGKIANAYLFYGPERVGKTLVATQFAKSLFCVNNDKPCEECAHCMQIENGIHPDIFRIIKLEDKNNIVIEQIREMKERVYQSSFFPGYKIGIIEKAEFLNDNAWNSLLKVLEEPPKKTIIIIIANKISNIPLTIISRCQKIKFSAAPENIIFKYLLEDCGAERGIARTAARLAGGKIGLAKDIAFDQLWMDRYNKKMNNCLSLLDNEKKLKEKNDLIAKFIKDSEREVILDFFNMIISLLRDFILLETNPDLIVNLMYKEQMEYIRKKYNFKTFFNLLEKVLQLKSYLNHNVSGKLLLENFVLDIN
ncbi:MAG: AAA family ATPase [bacterium]